MLDRRERTPSSKRRLNRAVGRLRVYFRPILMLLVAGPIATYAVVRSFAWFNAPFPGFFLMENAVIPTVSGYGWPAEKATLAHSQVVAVDGTEVRSSGDVYHLVASRPVGTQFTYTFRKHGVKFQRTLASMSFTTTDYLQVYSILLLIAFMNLVTGAIVGFMQPQTRQARVYLLLAFAGCVYPSTAVFLHQSGFPWLTRTYLLAESLFPATFIHLALVFPVERRFAQHQRLWVAPIYALSVALAVMKLHGFYRDPPELWAFYATFLYIAVSFPIFLGALFFGYWENRAPIVRLRIKALLPSVIVGGGLAAISLMTDAISTTDVPMQLGLLFVPLFYASVAYSIAKHDLFDIDRVVRQTFVYGLLSIIVIGVYALVLVVPARLVPTFVGENQTSLGMVFVLLLALAFDPLRRGVQNVVDRAFYRGRLDYQATISNLSEVLTTLLDLREVLTQVTRVVTDAMHLESTAVCLLDEDGGRVTLWLRGNNGQLLERDAAPSRETLSRVFEHPPEQFAAETIVDQITDPSSREQTRRFLAEVGADVLLPLAFRNRPIGMLALGSKRSGRPFSSEDIQLLRTLANQTAIAVQNARSYQGLQNLTRDLDEKVRQRTQELRESNDKLTQAYNDLKSAETHLVQSEKMASLGQLVAGVAHELNNPASFVHGGLSNLQEYVGRFVEVIRAYEHAPLADPERAQTIESVRAAARLDYLLRETPELLRICTEGSERIKKIVDDLRVFARADQGERILTELTEGIDSTVRLVSDRLGRHKIRVTREYGTVPLVEINPGQINQVWMNLISNALDAVEGRPDPVIGITARTCREPGQTSPSAAASTHDAEWVEVVISDNGVGIRAADVPKLFDPFFTTKPIGRGTGLGLSIAYGAVKSHGGTIEVDSEPGHGTAVRVRLPVRQSRGH